MGEKSPFERLLDIFWHPGDEHNEWHVGLHAENSSCLRPYSSRRALMALCVTKPKNFDRPRGAETDSLVIILTGGRKTAMSPSGASWRDQPKD